MVFIPERLMMMMMICTYHAVDMVGWLGGVQAPIGVAVQPWAVVLQPRFTCTPVSASCLLGGYTSWGLGFIPL